jgi:GT2 family glycosyltransferase
VITVAIPTYNRGAIAAETVRRLLDGGASPIIVVDQTPESHPDLVAWNEEGRIRLIRLATPSIPRAMNEALRAATTDVVLFVDDDVEPTPQLVAAHEAAHDDPDVWAVQGQVLQPGEVPEHFPPPRDALDFHFNHDRPLDIGNTIACNLSVKRARAIEVGGFDENYIGAGHRIETDFAFRIVAAGGRIRFDPRASLRHLKLSTGGLRSYGDHRTSASPAHSVGDYYFAIHHRPPLWRYALQRIRKNVVTRFHATHPWTIPAKLAGEIRGVVTARRLAREGRKLLEMSGDGGALRRETP